jgi:hypothetical protein
MPDAIRWTIAFGRDHDARLTRTIRFRQRVLPAELSYEGDEAGFWIELRGAGNSLIYRRVIDDPFRDEGPAGERALETDRSPAALRDSVLSVVTPFVPGSELVVMSSGLTNERALPVFRSKVPD